MLDALPRVASLRYKGKLIVGHGSGVEILGDTNIEKRVPVFEENGSNVYGLVAAEDGIYVHGEKNLAFIEDLALFRPEKCLKPAVQQFHDHILCLKVLSESEVVILFNCNYVALYDRNRGKQAELVLRDIVKSEHSSVLLRGLIVGDSWPDVYTVVGTVFGLILVSRPSQGSAILRKYTGHTGMIFDMTLSHGLLFTVSDDRSLRIWEYSHEKIPDDCGELTYQFGHSARPFAICAKDDLVFTAGIDQTVYKWRHEAGRNLRIEQRFFLNIGCIRNLTFFENNLYCCSENGGLVSFNPNLPAPTVTTISTCEDLRGFARCGRSLYTVNGRGQLFEDDLPIQSHLNLRHLIASPLHETEQYVVAYGEKSVVVIHRGEQKLVQTEARILSCVCSSGYTFIYTADKIGVLHSFETSQQWPVSFEESLNSIGKRRPFIPSSMCLIYDKSRLTVLIGSVCGHLMTIRLEKDQTTSCRLSHKIDRHFKGEQILSIKNSARLVVSCLVKNVGIVEFEWIEEDPFLEWMSTRTASNTLTLDSPSSYVAAESRNFLVGFHSTDFHLLDEDGLALFSFTCGGANRSWTCYMEKDTITFEFFRHQQLIRVSQLLLKYRTHQPSFHKSQIVFVDGLQSTDERILCCTGSNDTSMCFTSIDRHTGKWSILRRIYEASGFICCHSRTEGEEIQMVAGSGKGKIVLWRIDPRNSSLELRQISEYHHEEDIRVLDLHFGPSDRLGAVLGNGTVEIFSSANRKLTKIAEIPAPDLSLFTKIRWLDHSSRFVAISTSGKMFCWELGESGVSSIQKINVTNCGLSALEVTDCYLLVGDEAGHVTIFENLVKVQTLAYHSSTVTDIKFDAHNSRLFSTSLDCRLAIFHLNQNSDSGIEFSEAKSLSIWDPSQLFVDRSHVVAVGSGITSLSI